MVEDELFCFQIGAGLYAVGRPVQKRNITQQKRTAKSAPITPCPLREGPYSTVFSVSRPMDPLMWLAGLLALSGDVETNPGPTTQTWTCDMCSTEITRRQTSYRCNSSPSHWVHKHCTTLRRNTDYTPTWKCNIHNQQNNTITDKHHQLTNNNNNMSPTLFNIYMSDLPTPPRDIHVTTYADDITIYSSDKNYTIAQQRLQPYLEDVQTWTKTNDLKLNASKNDNTLHPRPSRI